MNILPEIDKISNELKKIFKDLHQHPELGFEEVRTSEIVKKRLQDFGVDEIHTYKYWKNRSGSCNKWQAKRC